MQYYIVPLLAHNYWSSFFWKD